MPQPQPPDRPRTPPLGVPIAPYLPRPLKVVSPREAQVARGSPSQLQDGFSTKTGLESRLDNIDTGGDVLPGRKKTSALWAARICLLPSSLLPGVDDINTYERFLSKGVTKMVGVNGPSSEAFASAILQAFGPLMQSRPWTPLLTRTGESCDPKLPRDIPVLMPLDPSLAGLKYDFDFLRTHCAILNADGGIDSLYIAVQNSVLSWDKDDPLFNPGKTRPKADTANKRPSSYYGSSSKPPPSNARYWQHPNPILRTSFTPQAPYPPPSAPQFYSPFPAPPPQQIVQPPVDYLTGQDVLAARFDPYRPRSAMGRHIIDYSPEYDDDDEGGIIIRRPSSTRRNTGKHADRICMPPPPRPSSARPVVSPFAAPPLSRQSTARRPDIDSTGTAMYDTGHGYVEVAAKTTRRNSYYVGRRQSTEREVGDRVLDGTTILQRHHSGSSLSNIEEGSVEATDMVGALDLASNVAGIRSKVTTGEVHPAPGGKNHDIDPKAVWTQIEKRKRSHMDTRDLEMPDTPVLHYDLTWGLNRLMSRPDAFPPSPDYSGSGEVNENPASPLKKSKHSKHHKSSWPESRIFTGIASMLASGNSKRDLISTQVLDRAGLLYEAHPDHIDVLGKLSSEEITELKQKSAKVCATREGEPPSTVNDQQANTTQTSAPEPAHKMDPMIMLSVDNTSTKSFTMVIRAPYTEQTTLDNFLGKSFGHGKVSLLWKQGHFHCTLPRSLSPDELEFLDQIVHAEQYSPESRRSSSSNVLLEDQDATPTTAALHRAETQGNKNNSDTDMDDILCYLLPRSAAASQEIDELLLRGSPHVQIIPGNLKQYLKMIGGNEYGIALRRSALRKNPSKGFLFGANASICDILFTSEDLRQIQFRIYEDENGVVTLQDQSIGDRMHDATATGVFVTHPGDGSERASATPELTKPLKNASTIFFTTEAQNSRWDFSIFLPVHEESSEYADVESLASVTDVPTLTSGDTFSSLGSQLDVSEATEELAKLLLKDEELGSLFHNSLQRTATEKIERNYTRLLAGFARDLRREATNPVEHHVGRLVKFRARFISQMLVSAIDPSRRDRMAQWESFLQQNEQREERLEEFLDSLASSGDFVEATKSAPAPVDSDGNVSDESGEEGNLPKLSQIKDFILSSKALVTLRTRLKNFISPEHTMPGEMEQSDTQGMPEAPVDERPSTLEGFVGAVLRLVVPIDQRTVASLTDSLLRLVRPSIPEGHQRITWVCGCGKPMYSDVQELHDGQAACLEQDLRRAADGAARSAATSGSNNAPRGTTQRQGSSSSSSNNSAMSGSTLAPPPRPNSPPVASGISPANPGASLPVTNRFVLLCINGPRFPQLRQVPLASQQVSIAAHDNDRILFDNIRRAYIEVRRSYQPSFHPETPTVIKIFVGWMHHAWKANQKLTAELFKLLRIQWLVWWVGDDVFFVPKSANFVKFEVIPIKEDHVPEILESACLPPEEEVLNKKNYHYAPCPQQVRNALLRIPWLHELFEPGLHTSDFWTKRTPKKLIQMLNYPSPDPVIGWGVHIVEGPNWHALAVLTIIFNVLSLVIASIYSAITSDVSSGFAVGSFFLAVETMVVTLVLAVVTTSLLYNS